MVLEVKGIDRMTQVGRTVQILTMGVVEISMVEISQETVAVMVSHLAIKVKTLVILVETKEIEVEVEERLIPAQMLEGLEWLVRL